MTSRILSITPVRFLFDEGVVRLAQDLIVREALQMLRDLLEISLHDRVGEIAGEEFYHFLEHR